MSLTVRKGKTPFVVECAAMVLDEFQMAGNYGYVRKFECGISRKLGVREQSGKRNRFGKKQVRASKMARAPG